MYEDIKFEKLKIFNHEIIKHKVPTHIYDSKSLRKGIDNVFSLEEVLKTDISSYEKVGKGYSTSKFQNSLITDLPCVTPLLNYISKVILKSFYKDQFSLKKIFYERMWMNKIYKNCSGKCHVHDGSNDGTAIFYYNAPKNGSKLIILEKKINGLVKESHQNISHYLDVETGDLVLHDKKVPHAVSQHMIDEERICFIFNFKLV